MNRITIVITGSIAAAAVLIAVAAGLLPGNGHGGRAGGGAKCATSQTAVNPTGPNTDPCGPEVKDEQTRSGQTADHVAKPGENKQ